MNKIYDCFPYFCEKDICYLRLSELYDSADRFVVIEADTTHLGDKKDYVFWDDDRLKQFEDKISYFQVQLKRGNGWGKENEQRYLISEALKSLNLEDSDIIISSDLDEIPNKERFSFLRKYDGIYAFNQMFFVYFLNLWAGKNVTGSIGLRYSDLKELDKLYDGKGLQHLRDQKDYIPRIEDGGWHFSYVGGANQISKKARAIAEGNKDPNNSETKPERFAQDMLKAVKDKISPYSQEPLSFVDLNSRVSCISFLTAISGRWEKHKGMYKSCPNILVNDLNKFEHLIYNKEKNNEK